MVAKRGSSATSGLPSDARRTPASAGRCMAGAPSSRRRAVGRRCVSRRCSRTRRSALKVWPHRWSTMKATIVSSIGTSTVWPSPVRAVHERDSTAWATTRPHTLSTTMVGRMARPSSPPPGPAGRRSRSPPGWRRRRRALAYGPSSRSRWRERIRCPAHLADLLVAKPERFARVRRSACTNTSEVFTGSSGARSGS